MAVGLSGDEAQQFVRTLEFSPNFRTFLLAFHYWWMVQSATFPPDTNGTTDQHRYHRYPPRAKRRTGDVTWLEGRHPIENPMTGLFFA